MLLQRRLEGLDDNNGNDEIEERLYVATTTTDRHPFRNPNAFELMKSVAPRPSLARIEWKSHQQHHSRRSANGIRGISQDETTSSSLRKKAKGAWETGYLS